MYLASERTLFLKPDPFHRAWRRFSHFKMDPLTTQKKRSSKRKQAKWLRPFRYWYLRFVRLQASSPRIARGLALGVFAGCFPLFGLQIALGVLLAWLFHGSKLAAVAGTWISNPFTYVPIFIFNFKVGQWLLHRPDLIAETIQHQPLLQLLSLGQDFLKTLFLGCTVVGVIAAIMTYFLSLRLIQHWRQSWKDLARLN